MLLDVTELEAMVMMNCVNDTVRALDHDRGKLTVVQHAEFVALAYALTNKIANTIQEVESERGKE